jgi:hypothetical protein
MNRKLDIEARLDRSLRKQLAVPKLDGRFDAAVWARIEAEQQRAPDARLATAGVPKSARWLLVSNAIGGAVALVLVLYFGAQWFGGVAVNVPAVSVPHLPVPDVSARVMAQIEPIATWAVTVGSLAFALMFTSIGRRLRSEFRQIL